MDPISPTEILRRVRDAGYDGIEFSFPLHYDQKAQFLELAGEAQLITIAQQCFAAGEDFISYRDSYKAHLENLAGYHPLLINAHTGRDYYTFDQNAELIRIAEQVERERGVKVLHETHRGRFAFSAFAAGEYIRHFPAIRFTADFSHFCCVSESYLEDQHALLSPLIPRSCHIHARVGFPQGPQITDPRLPEWETAVHHHLQWWDAIVHHHRTIQTPVLTITPEFGPCPYMAAMPFTRQPIADQWAINVYMMELLRDRYTKNE
jgi:sugar phosphate isomerase/epimerase